MQHDLFIFNRTHKQICHSNYRILTLFTVNNITLKLPTHQRYYVTWLSYFQVLEAVTRKMFCCSPLECLHRRCCLLNFAKLKKNLPVEHFGTAVLRHSKQSVDCSHKIFKLPWVMFITVQLFI